MGNEYKSANGDVNQPAGGEPPSPESSPESLFAEALRFKSPAERKAYLERVCKSQPELRLHLEQLLEAHELSGDFLDKPALTNRPTIRLDLAPEEAPGTVIGRYKLLQRIGEGGMGVVYMAEQREPVVRKVAFKIIKLGMDTRQVVARFEAERQALALMDHPNIAKVLDGGATETGRPYFVMELVQGVPITEYCDRNRLSTKERLELFIPVCQAIQHAHQKGIIHRDIKPSNVMVTLHDGQPVPRVIDFGIAKATNQRLTEKTLFTNYATMIGTPAYMSPEQAEMSGLDIDTRSDVYSLGVLLYELLTGTTPFDMKELLSRGYGEMQRIIAEQEPPKPSTRMSTLTEEQRTVVAKNRSTDASAVRNGLIGDLDWIVMKCLEKDRTRRYETSNGLAADLRRHLNNELISARPPTTAYLLGKMLRRNKTAFVTGALIAILMVAATAVSLWQAFRATRAERIARQQATAAQTAEGQARTESIRSAQTALILQDMLASASPHLVLSNDTVLRSMLERTEERLEKDQQLHPCVKSSLLKTLAEVYRQMDQFPKAKSLGREALRLAIQAHTPDHSHTLEVMLPLSFVIAQTGGWDEARKMQEESIRLAEKIFGPASRQAAEARTELAETLRMTSDFPAAERETLRAIEILRKLKEPELLGIALGNLGGIYYTTGEHAKSLAVARESVEMYRTNLSEFHPNMIASLVNMANVLKALREDVQAELAYREVIKAAPVALGKTNRALAQAFAGLGGVVWNQGRHAESLELSRQALQMYRDVWGGDNHPDVALSLGNLARDLARTGASDEALPAFRDSQSVWRRIGATNDPNYSTQLDGFGTFLMTQGKYSEAEPLLNEALYHETNRPPVRFLDVAHAARKLAICRYNQGDQTNMLAWLKEARTALETIPTPWINRVEETEELAENLSLQLWEAGELQLGEALQRRTVESKSNRLPPETMARCGSQATLGAMLGERAWQERGKGNSGEALHCAKEAEQITWEVVGRLEGTTNATSRMAAQTWSHLGWARLAVAVLEPTLNKGNRSRLFSSSEDCLTTSYQKFRQLPTSEQAGLRTSLVRLVWLYDFWGREGTNPAAVPLHSLWNAQLAGFDRRATAAASQPIVSNPGAAKNAADQ